jgi:hypothetical protein
MRRRTLRLATEATNVGGARRLGSLIAILVVGGLSLAGCNGAGAPVPGVVTTASTQTVAGPETPIAWVASPQDHTVCTPYRTGEVCATVEGYHARPVVEPSAANASSAPGSATVSIRIDFRNTSRSAVSVPAFSGETRLTLFAQSPETTTFLGDVYASGATIRPRAGSGCAPTTHELVIAAGGSAIACGSFRVYTAAWLYDGGSRPHVYRARFADLTIGGFADFASRFAFTQDDDMLPLEGPFAPPGWSTGAEGGQFDPFTSDFALAPAGLGSGIVTGSNGTNLAYQVPPRRDDAVTSAQDYLCGWQAQDSGGEPYQCDATPEDPVKSGTRIVLHLWIGVRQARSFTASIGDSWIDVQYACTRSGCSSERLFPSRTTGSLPRGCGSVSALVIQPTPALQRRHSPNVLSQLPADLTSFDRRALCELYVVPAGSRMYEGGVSVRFEGLSNGRAMYRAWHTTFFQLPWGYF